MRIGRSVGNRTCQEWEVPGMGGRLERTLSWGLTAEVLTVRLQQADTSTGDHGVLLIWNLTCTGLC